MSLMQLLKQLLDLLLSAASEQTTSSAGSDTTKSNTSSSPETTIHQIKTGAAGLKLIKESEGLRLQAYLPTPDDVWTIGYGHTAGVKKGQTITLAEAHAFLLQDVEDSERVIAKHVKVPLTRNQFDALVSFIHNFGETKFKTSTLLKKLNAKDYAGAANEFDRWVYQVANGKKTKLPGLVTRRAKEKELFLK